MKKMNIVNAYTTPDEWKERARKIPAGRTGTAAVKSLSPIKAAAVAAIAIGIGAGGFLILHTSNDEMIPPYEPAPTQVSDPDARKELTIKQKISAYYPKSNDYAVTKLFDQYNNKNCCTKLTDMTGCPESFSDMLKGDLGRIKAGELNEISAECDGYILSDKKISLLIRLDNTGTSVDTKDIARMFSTYVSVVDSQTGTQVEKQVEVTSYEGFMAQFLRVDITLGKELMMRFNELTVDTHILLTDKGLDTVITDDEAGQYSGRYHYDIRIRQAYADKSEKNDSYDTVSAYLSNRSALYPIDQNAAYQLTGCYYSGGAARYITRTPEFHIPDDSDLTDKAVLRQAENNSQKSYVKSVDIDCDGIITDGVNMYALFRETSVSLGMVENLNSDLIIKAYLKDTGEEISLLGTPETFEVSTEGLSRMIIRLRPDNILSGRTVQLHIISGSGDYGEQSYHYMFEISIPETSAAEEKSAQKIFASATEGTKLLSSSMGMMITGCDALISQKEEEARAAVSPALMYIEGEELSSGSYDLDGQYKGVVSDEALTTDRDVCRLYRVRSADGGTAGYYISYNSPDNNVYSIHFFDEDI